MNFAAFSTASGTSGAHFVTTNSQIPVAKLQQNVTTNGLSQVVGMVGGVEMGGSVQYVRTVDGSLQAAPHVITLPIALPGAKPGDPQQTVQIQVLSPNLTLQAQQQPKYQMQIPIQGFQQGGAVLTVAYSQDTNEGIQFLGTEGLQVLVPQDMHLVQQAQTEDSKEGITTSMPQVFIQNQQIVFNHSDGKPMMDSPNNNNTISDMGMSSQIIIKEECDETTNDDDSSQGTEGNNDNVWYSEKNQDLINYLNKLPQQQAQSLPVSLQQFLRLNPIDKKPVVEVVGGSPSEKDEDITEAIISEDGTLKLKKKRKYKKKPQKPARPKPGQVIIATSSDGSPIYCCPECHMAFPEKEQLELHLSVHKIERRFICGICGAGLKRKEHLERHKLGHNPERPYVCAVCRKGFKRREHLNLHTVIHSGVKSEVCLECGKGFYRKDHLRKHTRSHESKRAREEASGAPVAVAPSAVMPEITIHVPTSANMQMPVQINIPQHVVSSLAAQSLASSPSPSPSAGPPSSAPSAPSAPSSSSPSSPSQSTLDALLAQHS